MKKCKWCGKEYKKLAKAHIIPKSFLEHNMWILQLNDYMKRIRAGAYDRDIICNLCEDKYKFLDDAAHKILYDNFEREVIEGLGEIDNVAYRLSNDSKLKIQKCLLLIVWRASISTRQEWGAITLSQQENENIKAFIEGNFFSPIKSIYSIFGFKIDEHSGKHFFPMVNKFEGVRFCSIDFRDYIFFIKLDFLPSPKFMFEYENASDFFLAKLKEMPENRYKAMVDMAKKHSKKFNQTLPMN
jgi:hypothetical protein